MKRLLVISIIILAPLVTMAANRQPPPSKETVAANEATKAAVDACANSIEVVDNIPSRPYTILSMVSEKPEWEGTGLEKLLAKLKKKACKLGADALIKYECHDVTEGGSSAFGSHAHVNIESVPVCTGTAVKWK